MNHSKSLFCLTSPDFQTQYQSPDDAQPLLSDSLDIASYFCDALIEIDPSIAVTNASYPVLRVFASWPADAKLDRTLEPRKKKKISQAEVDEDSVNIPDPDLHPLATLHLEHFNNIGKMLSKSWFRGDLEQREVVFAKNQSNDREQVQRLS
jgi:hypothetical protein